MMNPASRPIPSLLVALAAFASFACGDGGGESALQGYLVDSPVQGVDWETESMAGVTGPDGGFQFHDGETIRFSHRGVVLGTIPATPTVTPFELAGVSSVTSCVEDIAVFLQTLDDDLDPANGIVLPPGDSDADGTLCAGEVDALLEGLTNQSPVSASAAIAHLMSTLADIPRGSWAGTYAEDGSGDRGTWKLTLWGTPIRAQGCWRSRRGEGIGLLDCSVEVSVTGNGQSGSCDGFLEWDGEFGRDGVAEGTWEDIGTLNEGSFAGLKVSNSLEPSTCASPGEMATCEEACGIWYECIGWEQMSCMGECLSDGDWGGSYLRCLREVADSCDLYECED